MEQVVYGDVLFLINFSMDFLALYICARVLHRKIKTVPFVISASLGGAYSVASLFIELPRLFLLIFDVAIAFAMCAVAFEVSKDNKFSLSRACISSFTFFVCEMLFGGAVTALFNMLGCTSFAERMSIGDINSAYSDIPLWMFVFLAGTSAIITYIGGRLFGRGVSEKTVEIRIENGGNTLLFSALVDSGNLLSDPLTGKPVVVIGYEKIKNFLPPDVRAYAYDMNTGKLSIENAKRIRHIPASGVGHSTVLVGFVPERMTISAGNKSCEADAVVAIEKNVCDFGGLDAIVPIRLAKL